MKKYQMNLGLIMVSLLTATGIMAQTGTISGRVIDKDSQTPLVGVNIIVNNTSYGAATDQNGYYYIENIPVGTYNLTYQMMGYEKLEKLNIPVNPDRITQMNVSLGMQPLLGEDVVVSARAFVKAQDAVVSDRNIDYTEMMRDPGGVYDVQRMMQALPAVVSGSDQENEIIVRGGSPGENLFLLDNIEISNPNHFGWQGTGGGPISAINPLFIQEVDFYAGAFPARFGGKASSVMNIKLKEGNRQHFHANVDMGMSGIGLFAEGPIQKGQASYMVGFHKSYLDLLINSFGLTAVPHYYDLQAKLVWYLSPKTKLIWNGLYGNDAINIEQDGGTVSAGTQIADVKGYEYATGLSLKTLFDDNRYLLLTLSKVGNYWDYHVKESLGSDQFKQIYLKDDLETEWTLKGDYFQRINAKQDLRLGFNLKQLRFDHHDWAQADTAWTFYYHPKINPGDSTFYFAADQYYADYSAAQDSFSRHTIARISAPWEIDHNINTRKAAVYGQYKWKPLEAVILTMGLRYAYFEYSESKMLAPRLGFSYHLSPVTTLNLAYGKHFQEPAYFYFTQNLEKNRNLKSYTTEQYVGSIEHLFREDIKGTVEIYQKNYQDLPISNAWVIGDSLGNANNEMLSLGNGYARGLELFFQKKLNRNFNLTLSYSHYIARRTDVRKPEKLEYTADYDFRNVFTFISGYRWDMRQKEWYRNVKEKTWWQYVEWLLSPGDELEMSIRWRYTGGKPYTKQTYDPYLRKWYTRWDTVLNTERLPAYHRLDVQIVRRFIFEKSALVVYFDIMNIYGRKNIWNYTYNADGSKSNVYQYSLFPVGGFVWEL